MAGVTNGGRSRVDASPLRRRVGEAWRAFRYMAGYWWSGVATWCLIVLCVYFFTQGQREFPGISLWVYLLVVPVAGWLVCAILAIVAGLTYRDQP